MDFLSVVDQCPLAVHLIDIFLDACNGERLVFRQVHPQISQELEVPHPPLATQQGKHIKYDPLEPSKPYFRSCHCCQHFIPDWVSFSCHEVQSKFLYRSLELFTSKPTSLPSQCHTDHCLDLGWIDLNKVERGEVVHTSPSSMPWRLSCIDEFMLIYSCDSHLFESVRKVLTQIGSFWVEAERMEAFVIEEFTAVLKERRFYFFDGTTVIFNFNQNHTLKSPHFTAEWVHLPNVHSPLIRLSFPFVESTRPKPTKWKDAGRLGISNNWDLARRGIVYSYSVKFVMVDGFISIFVFFINSSSQRVKDSMTRDLYTFIYRDICSFLVRSISLYFTGGLEEISINFLDLMDHTPPRAFTARLATMEVKEELTIVMVTDLYSDEELDYDSLMSDESSSSS